MTTPPLDVQRVMAEIHDDVRRRRAAGQIPPGLERELDAAFARLAPPDAVGGDVAALVERAERASFIDVDVPTDSNLKGAGLVKRGLRSMMAWYLRYLAQQTTAFASVTVRALRAMSERLEQLEDATPGASPRLAVELERLEPASDPHLWHDLLAARFASAGGRVLHAEAGRGTTVAALAAAGVDAYGVEPRLHLADAAVEAGLDVRPDGALEHLRLVAPDTLAGLVLSGCVDRLPAPVQLELADLAATRIVVGGTLAVVATVPEQWGAGASAVEADLVPGRPLQADTWHHLLAVRGFEQVEVATAETPVKPGPTTYVVTAVRAS